MLALALPHGVSFAKDTAPGAQNLPAVGDEQPLCDSEGSDSDDPERLRGPDGRWITATPISGLDTKLLLEQCGGPVAKQDLTDPQTRRHGYIRARALLFSAREREAMGEFRILCDADYGAACYQLALAERVGKGGEPLDQRLARSNTRKAARLHVSQAGADLLASADWVDATQIPALHEALLDGDLKAIPHTVSTQRVIITLYQRFYDYSEMFKTSWFTVDDQQNALKLRVPIVAERMRAAGGSVPPIFRQAETAGPNGKTLEDMLEETASTGTAWLMLGQRITAIEVGPGAFDAQVASPALNAAGANGERERYLTSLSQLMALWVRTPPAPDDARVCALFRPELRRSCLPMADYNPGNPLDHILPPAQPR